MKIERKVLFCETSRDGSRPDAGDRNMTARIETVEGTVFRLFGLSSAEKEALDAGVMSAAEKKENATIAVSINAEPTKVFIVQRSSYDRSGSLVGAFSDREGAARA